jgi:hypothetical protein
MASPLLDLQRSVTVQPAPTAPAGCSLDCLAHLLGVVLERDVLPVEILERAVALGLARYPPPNATVLLPLQTVARLFLAGYHLPIHIGEGTLKELTGHLRSGRRLFVLLNNHVALLSETDGIEAYQLTRSLHAAGPLGSLRDFARQGFEQAWQAAGCVLVVAARGWTELPRRGRVFFGGSRDPDGTYYWNTAECVTDGQGYILHCS